MSKSNNIAKVVAIAISGGFKYVAINKDGSQEVIRAKATTQYANAFVHNGNVNTGKPAGLPSSTTFGKKSSYPDLVIATYPIELVAKLPSVEAPKAKAPAKAKKEAPAKVTPAPAPKAEKAIKVPAKRTPKPNSYKALAAGRFTESKVENPVYVMWNLCNENTDKSRKEVIELAVKAGISFYTARTQYQLWLTAYRNSN